MLLVLLRTTYHAAIPLVEDDLDHVAGVDVIAAGDNVDPRAPDLRKAGRPEI